MKIYNPAAIVQEPPLAKYRALPVKDFGCRCVPLQAPLISPLDVLYYEALQEAYINTVAWSLSAYNRFSPEVLFGDFLEQAHAARQLTRNLDWTATFTPWEIK